MSNCVPTLEQAKQFKKAVETLQHCNQHLILKAAGLVAATEKPDRSKDTVFLYCKREFDTAAKPFIENGIHNWPDAFKVSVEYCLEFFARLEPIVKAPSIPLTTDNEHLKEKARIEAELKAIGRFIDMAQNYEDAEMFRAATIAEKHFTPQDVAKEFNVTDKTVLRWCQNHGTKYGCRQRDDSCWMIPISAKQYFPWKLRAKNVEAEMRIIEKARQVQPHLR
jgi:hypothetical protein